MKNSCVTRLLYEFLRLPKKAHQEFRLEMKQHEEIEIKINSEMLSRESYDLMVCFLQK